jgi:hypothetical protein
MSSATQGGSGWRCFPVGLRPPSKHLHPERTNTNIIKQYVNEQIYFKYIFMPYGTKLRVLFATRIADDADSDSPLGVGGENYGNK